MSKLEQGKRPGPESSVDKLYYSEMDKRHQELIQEVLGPYGQIKKQFDIIKGVHVSLSQSDILALQNNPAIRYVTPVRPLKPTEIRALRLREGASQAVFARYLNVTTGLVSQWERGEKRPQGASLKLLSLVAKNGLQAVA